MYTRQRLSRGTNEAISIGVCGSLHKYKMSVGRQYICEVDTALSDGRRLLQPSIILAHHQHHGAKPQTDNQSDICRTAGSSDCNPASTGSMRKPPNAMARTPCKASEMALPIFSARLS